MKLNISIPVELAKQVVESLQCVGKFVSLESGATTSDAKIHRTCMLCGVEVRQLPMSGAAMVHATGCEVPGAALLAERLLHEINEATHNE